MDKPIAYHKKLRLILNESDAFLDFISEKILNNLALDEKNPKLILAEILQDITNHKMKYK